MKARCGQNAKISKSTLSPTFPNVPQQDTHRGSILSKQQPRTSTTFTKSLFNTPPKHPLTQDTVSHIRLTTGRLDV